MATTETGAYVTRRDGGIAYAYTVTWNRDVRGTVQWAAGVQRDDVQVGRPSGSIYGKTATDAEVSRFVRDAVDAAIEHKLDGEY